MYAILLSGPVYNLILLRIYLCTRVEFENIGVHQLSDMAYYDTFKKE